MKFRHLCDAAALASCFAGAPAGASLVSGFDFSASALANIQTQSGGLGLIEIRTRFLEPVTDITVDGFDFGGWAGSCNGCVSSWSSWSPPEVAPSFSSVTLTLVGGSIQTESPTLTSSSLYTVEQDVPEPVSAALLGSGLLGFAMTRRRRRAA